MASTKTTYSAFMKETYTAEAVADLTERDHPLLAEISKDEEFVGSGHVVPVVQVNPQGVANLLADAQTNRTNIVGKKFTLTNGCYAGSVVTGLEVMKASRNNKGGFYENRKLEADGLYSQMSNDLSLGLWGTGGMTLGQLSAINGEVLTIADPANMANIEVGMLLCGSANDGSDSSHTLCGESPYYSDVLSVDRVAGTITCTDASKVVTADGDAYIFRWGSFYGNTTHFTMAGVQAYVAASESPANLYSMVRTSDPTALAGCRVAAASISGMSFEERIRYLGAKMAGTYGAKGTWTCWWHPEDFETLSLSLGNIGQRVVTDTTTRFGFQKIDSTIGGKPCSHKSDPHCPKGTAFVLDMPSWRLMSMGPLIQPVDEDGLVILRAATTNDFEYRLVSFPCPVTHAPRNNGRVALT